MSKWVTFGMYWQCYGQQCIELPDDIDETDMDAVRKYIKEQWDDIPLPSGDYVMGSDELDEESICIGTDSKGDGPVPKPPMHAKDLMGEVRATQMGDDICAENQLIRVELYNADEGICGDYNPDDPEDVNLLRFDVRINRNGTWEEVEDASYCTRLPANTEIEKLEKAARFILREYTDALSSDPYVSVKKLGERLSWISPDQL